MRHLSVAVVIAIITLAPLGAFADMTKAQASANLDAWTKCLTKNGPTSTACSVYQAKAAAFNKTHPAQSSPTWCKDHLFLIASDFHENTSGDDFMETQGAKIVQSYNEDLHLIEKCSPGPSSDDVHGYMAGWSAYLKHKSGKSYDEDLIYAKQLLSKCVVRYYGKQDGVDCERALKRVVLWESTWQN